MRFLNTKTRICATELKIGTLVSPAEGNVYTFFLRLSVVELGPVGMDRRTDGRAKPVFRPI